MSDKSPGQTPGTGPGTPAIEQLLETLRRCAPEDRDALLDDLCEDQPELRRLVEDRLLVEKGRSSAAFDADTLGLSQTPRPTSAEFVMPAFGPRFSPGQVIAARFAVVRYLARGGMGEVYEVEDSLLEGVRVALKVMRPEIAADPESFRRFKQEVVLARKVSHPNLCPIYDIATCHDTAPPFVFLTMKLLPGETLSSRIRYGGPVLAEEASTIASQMIAGVAALHDVGIVHRDIKPNNVMLDSSGKQPCVSIMDFGLARLHGLDAASLAGTFSGTPGYLAPELYLGGPPSQATDLFALGVLLHELLTGGRPQATALASPIELSPALNGLGVPPILAEAVKAFLSAEPNVRCAAFERVRQGLSSGTTATAAFSSNAVFTPVPATASASRRRPILGAAMATLGVLSLAFLLLLIPAVGERARGILFSSEEKHVAVLPLEIAGANPEAQAIGDGLMDSLAGKLSNLSASNKGLWVVPASDVRTSKVKDPASAMRQFAATIVVSGSFERTASVSRLRLSLIDPRKTRQIGFVDVETQSGDLAALQDEAVTRLARLINLSFDRAEPGAASQTSSTRAAYEDYLAGVGYVERQDLPGNIDRAITSLEGAIHSDPHFALAFAKLTHAYLLKYAFTNDAQWVRKAEDSSRRGAELDNTISANYVALASVHKQTGKLELAVQELKRAVNLDPTDSEAISGLASVYRDQGRLQEAEASYLQAAALHPDFWGGYNLLGNFYDDIGRPRDAIAQYQRAIQLTPDNSWPYINLASAYEDLDGPAMLGEAEKALKKSISLDPVFSAYSAYSNLGLLYIDEHRFPEAVEASQMALKLNDHNAEVWATLAAALEWLKQEEKANQAWTRAAQIAAQAISVNPQDAHYQAMLAPIHARFGRRDKSLDAIRISLALLPNDQYVLSQVADAYVLLGNRAEAIRYLKASIAHGMSHQQLQGDPFIPGLLSDPHLFSHPSSHS